MLWLHARLSEQLLTSAAAADVVLTVSSMPHYMLSHVSFTKAAEAANVANVTLGLHVNLPLVSSHCTPPLALEGAARMIAGTGSSFVMNDSNMLSHASPT